MPRRAGCVRAPRPPHVTCECEPEIGLRICSAASIASFAVVVGLGELAFTERDVTEHAGNGDLVGRSMTIGPFDEGLERRRAAEVPAHQRLQQRERTGRAARPTTNATPGSSSFARLAARL